jgi:4-diphosphocytidyl-2-C-methyl-D-erythritol kinase
MTPADHALPLPLRALAPAKINLGLFVGPKREDSRHELVSVMQSISFADELTLEHAPAGAERDEVVCPGVAGENLAARALELFRGATAWDEGWVRLTIDKRVPVAAGLGGGSADAAAALRLASAASGLGDEDLLLLLAGELGADVPAQVSPGRWLATGAGELLEVLPDPVSPFGVLVLAQATGLSTAEVYATADRLACLPAVCPLGMPFRAPPAIGGPRTGDLAHDAFFLAERRQALRRALELGAALPGEADLLHNDLQEAAVALCPAVGQALEQAGEVGAEVAFVSGSGPTVVGLFARANGLARAQRAAAGLAGREPPPVAAVPVDASFAGVQRPRT